MAVVIEVQDEVIETTAQEEQSPVHAEQSVMKGDKGDPGASAYELAVANGFEGTEEEWIESLNGQPGKPGNNGTSPTISVEAITGGYRITITDVNGTKTIDVMNGKDGEPGSGADITSENIIKALGYNPVSQDDIPTTAEEVGARPDTWTPTASDVGADPSGTAEGKMSEHNTNKAAHNDIRLLIEGLTTRLNALANSDDTTLDQMAEVVAYIKANRTLIESVTTGKVNVTDIINNLTTNVTNKPLSAAQGVVLKNLIDTLQTAVNAIKVPTKFSQMTDDVGFAKQTDVDGIFEEIADKLPKNQGASNVGKILMVGTDGNLVLTDMPEGGASGDVTGVVDESNNVLLSGNLADGTYTFKFVNTDGTETVIGTYVAGSVVAYTNILDVYTWTLNARWSGSSAAQSTCNGMIYAKIPIADVKNKTIRFKGFTANLQASGRAPTWGLLNAGNTQIDAIAGDGSGDLWSSTALVNEGNGIYSVAVDSTTFDRLSEASYLYINMAVSTTTITESNLEGLVITIDEEITE